MTSDVVSTSAHVELEPGGDAEAVRLAVAATLLERFEIEHVTVQVEEVACGEGHYLHP